jgi:Cu/Zn superoxide dismutase
MGHNLIMHSSDSQVKPIVGNKAIEVIEKVVYKVSSLQNNFQVLSTEEVSQLAQGPLEAHISQVYRAILKCTQATTGAPNNAAAANGTLGTLAALTERANLFTYLLSIATVAEVSTAIGYVSWMKE